LDCQRSIQLEFKHRFRGYLDLLPLGYGLYAGACTCPYARANRGTLPTAGESANQAPIAAPPPIVSAVRLPREAPSFLYSVVSMS